MADKDVDFGINGRIDADTAPAERKLKKLAAEAKKTAAAIDQLSAKEMAGSRGALTKAFKKLSQNQLASLLSGGSASLTGDSTVVKSILKQVAKVGETEMRAALTAYLKKLGDGASTELKSAFNTAKNVAADSPYMVDSSVHREIQRIRKERDAALAQAFDADTRNALRRIAGGRMRIIKRSERVKRTAPTAPARQKSSPQDFDALNDVDFMSPTARKEFERERQFADKHAALLEGLASAGIDFNTRAAKREAKNALLDVGTSQKKLDNANERSSETTATRRRVSRGEEYAFKQEFIDSLDPAAADDLIRPDSKQSVQRFIPKGKFGTGISTTVPRDLKKWSGFGRGYVDDNRLRTGPMAGFNNVPGDAFANKKAVWLAGEMFDPETNPILKRSAFAANANNAAANFAARPNIASGNFPFRKFSTLQPSMLKPTAAWLAQNKIDPRFVPAPDSGTPTRAPPRVAFGNSPIADFTTAPQGKLRPRAASGGAAGAPPPPPPPSGTPTPSGGGKKEDDDEAAKMQLESAAVANRRMNREAQHRAKLGLHRPGSPADFLGPLAQNAASISPGDFPFRPTLRRRVSERFNPAFVGPVVPSNYIAPTPFSHSMGVQDTRRTMASSGSAARGEMFGMNLGGLAPGGFKGLTPKADRGFEASIARIAKSVAHVQAQAVATGAAFNRSFGAGVTAAAKVPKPIDRITAAMQRLTSATNRQAVALNRASRSHSVFNQAGSVFIGLSLHRMWSSMLAKVAATKTEYMELEQMMQQIASITDRLPGSNLEGLKQQIKTSGVKLGTGPNPLASATYEALQTGIDDPQLALSMAEMSAKGAMLGGTDPQTVISGLLAVMNAYSYTTGTTEEQTKRATEVMDKLFVLVRNGAIKWEQLTDAVGNYITTSARLGYSIDETFAAVATLTKQGLSPSKATTSLNQMLNALINSREQAEAFAATMGIELSGVSVKARGLVGMLGQVNAALAQNRDAAISLSESGDHEGAIALLASGMSENPYAADILTEMFPDTRDLRAVTALTGDAFKVFIADLEDVKNAGGSMSKAMERYMKSIPFRAKQMNEAFNKVATDIWQRVIPTFLTLGETGVRVFGEMGVAFVEGIVKPIKILAVMGKSLDWFTSLFGSQTRDGVNQLASSIANLTGSLVTLVATLTAVRAIIRFMKQPSMYSMASGENMSRAAVMGSNIAGGLMLPYDAARMAKRGASRVWHGKPKFHSLAAGVVGMDGGNLGTVSAGGMRGMLDRASPYMESAMAYTPLGWGKKGTRGAGNLGRKMFSRNPNKYKEVWLGGATDINPVTGNVVAHGKKNAKMFGEMLGAEVASSYVGGGHQYIRTDKINAPKKANFMKRGAGKVASGLGKGAGFAIEGAMFAGPKMTTGLKALAKGTLQAAGNFGKLALSASRAALLFAGPWGLAIGLAAGALIALGVTVFKNTDGMKEAFTGMWENGIKPVLMFLAEGVWNAINRVLEYLSIFVNFWQSIIAIVTDPNASLATKIMDIMKSIGAGIFDTVQFVLKLFRDLFDGIDFIIQNGRVVFLRGFGKILDFVIGVAYKIKEAFDNFSFDEFIEKIKNLIPRAVDAFKAGITEIKDWIVENSKGAGAAVANGFNKVLELLGIDSMISGVQNFYHEVDTGSRATFSTLERMAKKFGALSLDTVFSRDVDGARINNFVQIQKMLDQFGISYAGIFEDNVFDDVEKSLINTKLLTRELLGGLDNYDFKTWGEFKKAGGGIGSAFFQPMINMLEKVQSAFGMTFEQLGAKYDFDPIQMTLGNFEDFLKTINNAVEATATGSQEQAELLSGIENLGASIADMDSTLAGKRMDQNVTIAPHIEIKVDGEVGSDDINRITKAVTDAINQDLKRLGRKVYGGI